MLDTLFESRNKTLSTLIKLGESLGRSLRENVMLFTVDSDERRVTYLTESEHLISGSYDVQRLHPTLENITVTEVKEFEDSEKFDGFVKDKVHAFIGGINSDNLDEASVNFGELLNLWEGRLKLKSYKKRLHDKLANVTEGTSILDTKEFENLQEVRDNLVAFLKENKEKFEQVDEIRNSVTLARTISSAFDLPYVPIANLVGKAFTHSDLVTGSLYETVCRQELLKKELLESKANFRTVWATSDKVKALAKHLYSEDDKVEQALAEAIVEVPYLALASKAQLRSIVENTVIINEGLIPAKDIQKFGSKLFEMKKDVKAEIVKVLNSKYGINIQSLKESPSFKSLVNTQIVIFEVLSRLSPKDSVQRRTLNEMAKMLKGKAGVQSLELNDELTSIFSDAGYDDLLSEGALESYLDFDKIAADMEGIGQVLRLIRQASAGAAQPGMGDPTMDPSMADPAMAGQDPTMDPSLGGEPGMPGAQMGAPSPEMDPTMGEQPGQEMPPNPAMAADPAADGDMDTLGADQPGFEDDDAGVPGMPAEQVPTETEADMAAVADGGEMIPNQPEVGSDQLAGYMQELESLIQALAADLGVEGGVHPGSGEEMGMGGEMGMEGEEEFGAEGGEEFPEEEVDLGGGDVPEEEGEGFGAEEGSEEGAEEEEGGEEPKKERPKGKKKFKLKGGKKQLPQERVGD